MEAAINRDEHIDAIRRRFGISLAAASGYKRQHTDEVMNSGEIFNLEGSGREKTLALLYMFSDEEKDPVIQKFRDETGMDDAQYNTATPLVSRYGTMLAAALIYNPSFYAMALNYQGAVNAGFSVVRVEENSFSVERNRKRNIIPFTNTFRIALAAVAAFAIIFFVTVIVRSGGTEQRISNDWIAGLTAQQDGISFVSDSQGARIGIKPPLLGTAMAADQKNTDFAKTAAYYTKAIRADKNNAALYVNRGIAYTLDGKINSAIKDFNKAIELNPNNTSAYFNRAVAYIGKGETEAAIADLSKIIAINPGDNEAYYALGALYIWQYEHDNTKPKALLEKALDAFSRIEGYKDANIIFDYYSRLL
jgi:tetratricopeptide (TPR) repeat protein